MVDNMPGLGSNRVASGFGHLVSVLVIVFILGLVLGLQIGGETVRPYEPYNATYPSDASERGQEGTGPDGSVTGGDGTGGFPGQATISDLRFNPPSVNVDTASVPGSWDLIEELILDYVSNNVYKTGGVRYVTFEADIAAEPVATPAIGQPEASPVLSEPGYFEEGNFQVSGVRELDLSAFNGTHIMIVDVDTVNVYRVYPPEALELVASLNLSSIIASRAPSVEVKVVVDGVEEANITYDKRVVLKGLLLSDDRIIVLGQVYYTAGIWASLRVSMPGSIAYFEPGSMYTPLTAVAVLDQGLNLLDVYTVNGYLEDARLAGDRLAVAVRLPSYTVEYGMVTPRHPQVNGELVPADSVVVVGEPEDYLTVLAVNASSLEYSVLAMLGFLGRGYMVMDANGMVYAAFNSYGATNDGIGPVIKVYSIDASPDGVELLASGEFEGWLRSTWQLQPYGDYLILLTGGLKVDMYILDPYTMEPVSAIESLTEMEQVYGVRVIDNILYMVTFRQIDPLFAIDISDPENPVVLGYLKAPGFDNYLHPIGGGFILGVGVEDGIVRISLYKLVNGTPTVVDRLYTGYYHTLLLDQAGHKAFTYNSITSIALIPVAFPASQAPASGYLAVKIGNNTLSMLGVLDHVCASRAYTANSLAYTVKAAPTIGPILYEDEGSDTCPVIVSWSLETLEEVSRIQG